MCEGAGEATAQEFGWNDEDEVVVGASAAQRFTQRVREVVDTQLLQRLKPVE